MVCRRRRVDASAMSSLQANISQRDLVRLAVLLCADTSGAKQRPASKGSS
jgi:hypothetical protein